MEDILKHIDIINLQEINGLLKAGSNDYSIPYNLCKKAQAVYQSCDNNQKELIEEHIVGLLGEQVIPKIFLITFLIEVTKDGKYADMLADIILSSEVDIYSKSYLNWQLSSKIFSNFKLKYEKHDGRKLYKYIFGEYKKAIPISHEWIPYEKRNTNLVIVIVNQFLAPPHGPTRTILDHCYTLQKELGKAVILINAAEFPREPITPTFEPFAANYYKKYESMESINYDGQTIHFFQSSTLMPNLVQMQTIIDFVAQNKPEFVYSIGGSCITADLCSQFVTVATLPCSYKIPVTEGNLYVLGRELRKEDMTVIEENNIPLEQVIESKFTFKLLKQNSSFSRADFKIPEDAYVLVIVGARLDKEITQEYAKWLSEMLLRNSKIFIVFVGSFDSYEKVKAGFEILQSKSVYLGFQNDVLAVFDMCDAYVNPPRAGGGTSAVEALSKGLPVFTLPNCDVGYAVGDIYEYENLQEMGKAIERCMTDKQFYDRLHDNAIKRANELFDTKAVLKKMINEIREKQGKAKKSFLGGQTMDVNDSKHEMERIVLSRQAVDHLEEQILIGRHIERYALVRQYLFGRVLDIACGVGYGSYLLAKNPDIKRMVGVDIDQNSIDIANKNFSSERVEFLCEAIENFSGEYDFLVSLETIEHLDNPAELYELVKRCSIKEIIVSFPHKKTTHYNKFHKWDLREEDILHIFKGYECINNVKNYDSTIMHLIKRSNEVAEPKRYLIVPNI